MSVSPVGLGLPVDSSAGARVPAAQWKMRRRTVAKRAAWAAVGAVCLLAAGAQAQTAHTESTIYTGTAPGAVAVDVNGNVYVSDTTTVYKLTPSGSGYTQTAWITDLTNAAGIAVDGSGAHIYVADAGAGQIYEGPTTGLPYTTSTATPLLTGTSCNGSYCVPGGVAVDGSGDVFFTSQQFPSSNSDVYELTGGVATAFSQFPVADGSIIAPAGVALDSVGNLFVSYYNYNTGGEVEELPWSGSWAGSTVSAVNVNVSGTSYSGIAVDASDNIYLADSGHNAVQKATFNGSSWGAPASLMTGVLQTPQGVAIDASGNIYIADSANHRVIKGVLGLNFGGVSVGTTSAGQTLTFTFDTAGNLGSTPYRVLTQGQTSLDFTAATQLGTACVTSHTYNAGDSCTVTVQFAPIATGGRFGAVELLNSSGNVIATGYLYGTGSGPQIAFAPSSSTGAPLSEITLDGSGVNSNTPTGIAVDAAGNIYLSETANSIGSNEVVKLAAGTYTQTVVASGLGYPDGVAVDGAGNVYIADSANQQLYEVTWNGSSYSNTPTTLPTGGTYYPAGVAVDASGNVYFTSKPPSSSDSHVYEIPVGGTVTQLAQFSGLTQPAGLAFDASGDLFVTDSGGASVWELQSIGSGWAASATQVITLPQVGGNDSVPSGVALDAAKDLYIADYNQHHVYLFPWTGSAWGAQSTVPTSTLDTTAGVALDGSGNLYVTECNCDIPYSHSRAFEELYATAPTLNFASTQVNSGNSTDSPQTVTVSNIGNLPLTYSDTFNDPNLNFTDTGSSCTGSASLTAGTNSCTFAFTFAPKITGLDTYGLLLSDNNLNNGSATQTITLNGTGTGVASFHITTPATVTAGQPFAITITAWDSNSHVVTGYNGTVNLVNTDGHISPTSYTLLNGTASLFVTLDTAETQTITATDSVHSYITGSSSPFTVDPGPVTQLVLGTPVPPSPETAGTPFTITVTAEDAEGNTVTSNTDAISFTSTDTGVDTVLPSGSLVAGTKTFSFTLTTEGVQTITATDSTSHLTVTTPGIVVNPSTATLLSAVTGTPQFALINKQFLQPLTVKLTDTYGNYINGTLVTFTPPGSGASAALSASNCTTAGFGTCSVTATANSIANPDPNTPYTVMASTASPVLNRPFSLTNVAYAVNPFGPAAAVGTTSTAEPVTVVFTTSGTLESVNVLTDGVPSLDFAEVTGGTCTIGTSYSAGQACSVDVTFSPKYAGERFGAVVLQDGNNNILGTEYLDPIGEGPQIVYEPGSYSTLAITGDSTPNVFGIAVDGGGNVFVSNDDSTQEVVEEVRQNNGYTQIPVANGFNDLRGVAVDGADNVYIADQGGQQLYKVQWNGVAYEAPEPLLTPGTYHPDGVAVDAYGNVYFTSYSGSNGNVYEILVSQEANSSSTVTALATPATQALGIAFDSTGDLFVTDLLGNQVYELAWNGVNYNAPLSLALTGLSHPAFIAIDAASNLYITDNTGNTVVKALFNGTSWNTPVSELQEVASVSILTAGSGQTDGTYTISATGGGGTGATVQIVISGGAITSATVTNPGTGYTSIPTFTVAEGGTPGTLSASLGMNSTLLGLSSPEGIALDPAGNIYVADQGNHRVIKDDRADAPTLNFDTTELYGTSADSPQTVTVENIGNQALTFNLSGPNGVVFPTDFPAGPAPSSPHQACANGLSLTTTTPNSGVQTSYCQLVIDFIPTQAGNPVNYSEDLVLTDNNLEGSPATQKIHLTGESYPQLYLQPTTANFGNQPQGSTSNTWTFTLENEGNAQITNINLQFINLTGEDEDNSTPFTPSPNPFTIVSNTCGWSVGHPFTLNSYQDCTILVSFTPQLTGHNADGYTAQLEVTDSSSATPPFNPVVANLSGTGSGLPVFLSPNTITFANQTAGSSGNPWTVTFNNVSPDPVTISNIALIGLDPSDFGFTTDCGSILPYTVPAYSNCRLFVYFSPASNAPTGTPLTATLQVTTSGSPTPLLLPLTGTANPLSASLAPNNLNFGSQQQGTQSSDSIANLNNNGDGPLDISSFSITAGASSYKIDASATTCGTSLPAHGNCNIAVYFAPSASTSGLVNGTLTVVDGAGTQTTSLTGIATSGSSGNSVYFSPGTINFGNQTVQSTSNPYTVTLTNSSSSSVSIKTYGTLSDGTDFNLNPTPSVGTCGAVLAPGNACTFVATFMPQTVGPFTATFTVTYPLGCSGASCNTSTLTLTGTGTAPTATLSPGSLNFGTVALGSVSGSQSLTLTNTSAGPVTVPTPVISGPFNLAGDTCPATLLGGGSCTISVTYTPSAAGNQSGTASVTLSYTGGSFTLSSGLSGVGGAPNVSLSTSSLNFGNVTVGTTSTLALTVTNHGAAQITLASITGISSPFAIVSGGSGNCSPSFTLEPSGNSNDVCTLTVTYSPQALGTNTDNLTLNFGSFPLNVTLNGTGVTPSVVVTPVPVNFGNITVGVTSPTLTATVTNNSDVAVQISGALNVLTNPPFAPGTVPVGTTACANGLVLYPSSTHLLTSCTISYTFTPQTVGSQTQVVSIPLETQGTNYTLLPVSAPFTGVGVLATGTLSPSSLNFGDVFINLTSALQVTVTNTSGTALTVSNGSFVPIPSVSGQFSMSSNCNGQPLSANGGQCTFSVTFAPTSSGDQNGTLTVPLTYPCNTPNPTTCSITLTASLFGQGDAPSMSVSPSSMNFGNVVYKTGPTVAQQVTIMNTANGPINISSITINPNISPDGFNITSDTCPATLNPGVSCNVYIDFNPQVVASYSAQLIISDNALGSPQEVPLSGAGINQYSPNISVSCSPNPIAYGQSASCTAYLSRGTGTVNFLARVHGNGPYSISLGSGTITGGSATSPLEFSTLANGTYDVEAVYAGDTQDVSVTATTTETINAITPTITMSCSPSSQPFGGVSTCTASLSPTVPNTSTVAFYWQPQGASSYTYLSTGTVSNGVSTTAAVGGGTPFTAGSFTIEAVYSGAIGYAGNEIATASFTVTKITPTVVTLPAPASTIDTGEPVGSVALTGGCVSAPSYSCGTGLPGSWTWTTPTDVFGTTGNHTESVTFIPTDSVDYASVTGTITFNVPAANMVIGSSSYNLIASPPSLTVAAGQSGTVSFTMIPVTGYTGTVTLSCSGLPSGVSCSFAPSSLTADGHGTAQTTVLTVSTVGVSASSAPANEGGGRALAGILMLPGLLCGGFLAWRRRKLSGWAKQLLVLAVLAFSFAGFVGCGGSSGGSQFTNPLVGTHTVTITAQATASSGSSTQSGSFTLTVTQ